MQTMRLSTGIQGLDEKLGGGLLPGTMTVLVGASGIGKTQFGLQFLQQGLVQENRRGAIIDMTARGDSQNHENYAKRMFDWTIFPEESTGPFNPDSFFDPDRLCGDIFRALSLQGKRVTRNDLGFDEWLDWKADLVRHLDSTISFLFTHFIRGTKRFIIDGVEPVSRQGESIQFELLEYIYHQIVQKDPEWVARDLFRQYYRAWQDTIAKHLYRREDLGCMLLYTSPESALESMIDKPMEEGDLLAGANTIIYLGRIREGIKFHKAMYISKHRGSSCSDEIIPFEINEKGLALL